jgi:L-threonylcarbamoyladenylate synthase
MIRIMIDPENPAAAALQEGANAIRDGRVVAIPTDTLYGLAADPFNHEAVQRVFHLKGRPKELTLPLIGGDDQQIRSQLGLHSALAESLAGRFWPGPLTLIVAAPEGLSRGVASETGGVAVRLPAHTVARALCRASGSVLTATSANISGQPATPDPGVVMRSLPDLDVLLDAGMAPGGAPSTIVDVRRSTPLLVRAGAIPWSEIQAWLATK